MKIKTHWLNFLLLFLIVSIGAFFRMFNLNWDQNTHIHPDERFLTMVGNAMKLPSSLAVYFNPATSPLNPVNVGYSFFVYGTVPLFINKFLAVLLKADTYNDFTLLGRLLSAFADLVVVVVVYKIVEIFESKYQLSFSTKFFAAFIYASLVLPMQLSHFYAVDTFLNCFSLLTFYYILKFHDKENWLYYIFSSLFFALAIGSKITAVYLLPLYLLLFVPHIQKWKTEIMNKTFFLHSIARVCGFFLLTYLFLRFVYPYFFETSNFLDIRVSSQLISSLASLKTYEGPNIWYPPGIQWITKPPVIFSLVNLVILGLGIPAFILSLVGVGFIVRTKLKTLLLGIVLWSLVFFLYQSTQFVKAMRYFILLYPLLAILAGIGFSQVSKYANRLVVGLVICLLLLWPMMYLSIYITPLTRITASRWMNEDLPDNSTILFEVWDDPLPLQVENPTNKQFKGEGINVFDQDTPEKWTKLNSQLALADYYSLSSNRGWGSIPTVPWKYPVMTKFYQDLFANHTNYRKVVEFTSYPSLTYLGIPLTLPDDWADESFTVYDHPKVMIFHNTIKQ